MFRRSLIVACLVSCLLAGCGKDEPVPDDSVRDITPLPEAPAGMVALREEPVLYMDTDPVTAAEYIAFLEDVKEPVPSGLADVPGATPLENLSFEEASRLATWQLKRVPSAQEWALAASVVGSAEYPWVDGEDAAVSDIYFVRDWRAGEPAETAAIDARSRLKSGANLGAVMLLVSAKKDELEAEMDRVRRERKALWDALKPLLFTRLDKVKELAAAEAAAEGPAGTVELLSGLVRHKILVAGGMIEGVRGATIESYEDKLTASRKAIADRMAALADATAKLHNDVTELTAVVEARGRLTVEAFPSLAALMTVPADSLTTIPAAREHLEALDEALVDLRDVKGTLEGMPNPANVRAAIAALDEKIAAVAVPDAVTTRLGELKEKLKEYTDEIGKVFDQEPLLIAEREELVAAEAQRAGVAAKLEALRGLVNSMGASVPPGAADGE